VIYYNQDNLINTTNQAIAERKRLIVQQKEIGNDAVRRAAGDNEIA
jgi:hypothetical protein